METGWTEEERVYVAQGVPRVEALIVDDGRGDDLLAEAEVLAAQALDEVGEEDVDFVEVLRRLEGGQVALPAQLYLLSIQEPFLVVAGLPEVARHLQDPSKNQEKTILRSSPLFNPSFKFQPHCAFWCLKFCSFVKLERA